MKDIDKEKVVDEIMKKLEQGGELAALGSAGKAPDGADEWSMEQIEERGMEIIEKSLGEDILPTLIVCRDDTIMEANVPHNRNMMQFLVNQAADPSTRTDWAVFITTAYTRDVSDEEDYDEDDYEYGDLSEDPESKEVQLMNMFRDGRQVTVLFDKDTAEELERVDTANEGEGMKGRMSFTGGD